LNKQLYGAVLSLWVGVALIAGDSTAPWYFWVQILGFVILSFTVPLTVDGVEIRRRDGRSIT
jgi:membrane protein implicated in regulation of membrane protease activity